MFHPYVITQKIIAALFTIVFLVGALYTLPMLKLDPAVVVFTAFLTALSVVCGIIALMTDYSSMMEEARQQGRDEVLQSWAAAQEELKLQEYNRRTNKSA